jgi:hypothetical protein
MFPNHADKLSVSRLLLYFLICFGVLYLIYSDSVTIPFAYHDQVRHFGEDYHHSFFKEDCANDHIANFLFDIGRPVAAGIECLVFKNVHDLEDISMVRLMVIALLAVCMTLVAFRLETALRNIWVALFLSGAIFALPGPNIAIFQGGIQNGLSVLLAILSYMILPDVSRKSDFRSPVFWSRIVLSLSLFVTALPTYPPYAYFFFVFTMVAVLLSNIEDWPTVRLKALRDFIFVAIASAIYFVALRLTIVDSLENVSAPYKPEISTDISARLSLLMSKAIPTIFNMWYVYTNRIVAFYVIAFVFSGLIASSILLYARAKQSGEHKQLLRFGTEKVVLVVALFFAASGAWIVSNSILVLLRIFFPAMAMLVVIVWWVARNWISLPLKSEGSIQKAGVTVACLMFLCSGVFANFSMNRNVWNTSVELMYIRSKIAGGLDKPIARIHVIRPRRDGIGYNKLPSVYDEFNRKGMDYMPDITDVVRTAMVDVADSDSFIIYGCDRKPEVCMQDFRPPAPGILVTHSREGEPIYETPNTLVIDLRDLVKGSGYTKSRAILIDPAN